MKKIMIYDTVIGKLAIIATDDAVTNLYFGTNEFPDCAKEETTLHKKAICELQEYFAGKRKEFTVPLNPQGTPFQLKVWRALETITYGNVVSYKDIAKKIGCEKGYRAVGNANGKNPLPIFIPCHRVIAGNGKLGGFSCGLDMKVKLLDIESVKIKS